MSNLEELVRPILARLITEPDAQVDLSNEQLRIIATWAVKCAMVLEHASPGARRIYTSDQRRFLMDHLVPPDNAVVWLAKYQGPQTLHDTLKNLKPAEGDFRGQTITVVIGYLVLQVMTGNWSASKPSLVVSGDSERWAPYLVQVWPTLTDGIRWPPSQTLTDQVLEAFTDRFLTGINLVEITLRD